MKMVMLMEHVIVSIFEDPSPVSMETINSIKYRPRPNQSNKTLQHRKVIK